MRSLAFDLDGTLISIHIRDYNVYLEVMKSLNRNVLPFNIYWKLRIEKTDLKRLININNDIDDSFVEEFVLLRSALIEEENYLRLDELFPNTLRVLDVLAYSYKCHLVTSRFNSVTTMKQISELSIVDYFSSITLTKGDKYEAYKKIENLFLIVGDTENDILPARQLSINSFALSTGIRSHSFLKRLNPTYLENDLASLLKLEI
jgi:phosphoglycolate phosphatase-like HAD superfamily hydrolase